MNALPTNPIERADGNGQPACVDPPPALPTRPRVEPMLLTRTQVAELLNISERTVRRMTASGELPGVCRLGGRVIRYSRRALEEWDRAGCPKLRRGRH